jgi:tetratricopeptide (TPR) repeat protein
MQVHAEPQTAVIDVEAREARIRDEQKIREARVRHRARPLRIVEPSARSWAPEAQRIAARFVGTPSARDRDDPMMGAVAASVADALDAEDAVSALALDAMAACAKALHRLASEEAALLLDRVIASDDPPSGDDLRIARAMIARFVDGFRVVAQRRAADEMFDALASAPAACSPIALRPLDDDRVARLGGRELLERLGARAAGGDAAATSALLLHRFAWGTLDRRAAPDGGDARGRALAEWARLEDGDDVELAAAVYSARPFALGDVLRIQATLRRSASDADRGARRDGTVQALRELAALDPTVDPDPLAAALAHFARGAVVASLPATLGRADDALADLRRSVEIAVAARDRVHASARACIEGNARLAMADLSAKLGRREQAARHAERAVAIDASGAIGSAGRELLGRIDKC